MQDDTVSEAEPRFPRVRPVGVDGLLVSFGDRLSEPANRAALAFRDALDREGPPGIEETSTSLVSTYLRFDLLHGDSAVLQRGVEALLASDDWYARPLPHGRRLWRIPTVFGTALAPQLEEAAAAAGMTPEAAIRSVSETRVRVQTIGFAPGQPYLGELDEAWNIPRQTALTDKVPIGALTVAIRQLVLFSVSTPTGWRHIGQTAFRAFRPESDTPFVLRPGDEVLFDAVAPEVLEKVRAEGPDGGATAEALP
ncbi:sensor histidine kinase inhibitor, KipI family [Tropicimonas sediminicola]|uniref:Sensor histidine kinase inhibitor, KipI family n=2 Tax=Tropicimonas sediminicola TaxID=1031541 RepID=A0A239K1P4_9RHOB|nr:sensor histidine kinase inhibitor, KipI family [Tropicimonas sediminicola]